MPSKAPTPCSRCGQKVVRNGLCAKHYSQNDRARGTAQQRGYDADHEAQFRRPVLEHAGYRCATPDCINRATVADHFPRSRRELVAAGENPNDPRHGRALCASCHGRYTAKHQGFGRRE